MQQIEENQQFVMDPMGEGALPPARVVVQEVR
jgi:hypothetical protein